MKNNVDSDSKVVRMKVLFSGTARKPPASEGGIRGIGYWISSVSMGI
jgi:hypothetical protein